MCSSRGRIVLIERNGKRNRGSLRRISRDGNGYRAQGNGCLLSPGINVDGLRRRRGLLGARGDIADSHYGGVDSAIERGGGGGARGEGQCLEKTDSWRAGSTR